MNFDPTAVVAAAVAVVSASVAVVTVAGLRLAHWMEVRDEADMANEGAEDDPDDRRARDARLQVVESTAELKRCPRCGGRRRALNEDTGEWEADYYLASAEVRRALSRPTEAKRLAALCKHQEKYGGPCGGFAVEVGYQPRIWQACLSCGAEWVVVTPSAPADAVNDGLAGDGFDPAAQRPRKPTRKRRNK